MNVAVEAVEEGSPGPAWKRLFDRFWPAYREWMRAGGGSLGADEAEARLRADLPELHGTYRRLVEVAGADEEAARFLTLYRPPPYLTGCSQAVWTGEEPALVRNYDYSPHLWEGVLLSSAWNGRRVVAMSDCLWGALDGINDAGLVVSLSFGGSRTVGDGYGSPLLLRFVLELADDAKDAVRLLRRVPTHMAYNVTVVDAAGDFFTAYLAPGRPPVVRRWPLATNHQDDADWHRYLRATSSLERERFLAARLGEPEETLPGLVSRFLEPPLYNSRYDAALGTLYTAVYYPARREMELRWPGAAMAQRLDAFETGRLEIDLVNGTRPSSD